MPDLRLFASTSNIVRFILKDKTTGQNKTGLSTATSGLIISTITDNEATATAYTAAGSTVETIATLGTFATPTATKCRFKEVDSTNHKGLYEFQFANARFAVTSAKRLVISVNDGESTILDVDYEIELTQFDPFDSVRMGITALPNAVANANGGLPILSVSGTTLGYTISTLTTYAGNTVQTGDAYAVVADTQFGNAKLVRSTTPANTLTVDSAHKVAVTLAAADVSGNLPTDLQTIKTQTVTCAASVTVLASVGTAATSTAQTGDSFALIGTAGAGLTALGDTRIAHLDADVTSRLAPTAAGRTLDVSTGGEAGVDWANVGSPMTTLALTGTTIATTQHVITDSGTVTTVTNQLTAAQVATGVWQDATAGDFTAASSIGKSLYTSGAVPGASGGLFIAGTNAATTITTALTTTFTGNLTGSVASVSGAVGSVTGSVGSVGTGGITTASFATGAINAAAIAADADAEIAAAVWDLAVSGHTTSGTFGAAVNAAGSVGDPWSTSLPGSYGSGTAGFFVGTYLDATVSSRTKPADTQAAVTVVGSVVGSVGNVTAAVTVGTLNAGVVTAASIASAALNGKGDWLLASSAPTNFSSLAISNTGTVTPGTSDGTLLLLDTFTDVDGTSLAAHTMDTGPGWTVHAGAVQINSNTAALVTLSGKSTTDAGDADVVLEADVTGTYDGPGQYAIPTLMLRVSNDLQDWYEWDLDLTTGGGRLLFSRVTGGVYTTVNSSVRTLTTGTTYRFRLECFDSTIRGYLDGVLVLSASDCTQGQTNTRVGAIFAKQGTPSGTARLDNFSVRSFAPLAADIATAVWTDTTASDFTVSGSPGKILVSQLGGAFTTASSSVFTASALANAPGISGDVTVGSLTAAALAQFFTLDTTKVYADAVSGSVVKEIGSNAGGGSVTVGGYAVGQDPATLVLDVAASLHNVANSVGAKINTTANVLNQLSGASITLISPVVAGGDTYVAAGDDYYAADGRALSYVNVAGTWADLTGATVTLVTSPDGGHAGQTVSMTVVTPTGPNQTVRAEPTAAQTTASLVGQTLIRFPLPSTGVDVNGYRYPFRIVAVLADGHKTTLVVANWHAY